MANPAPFGKPQPPGHPTFVRNDICGNLAMLYPCRMSGTVSFARVRANHLVMPMSSPALLIATTACALVMGFALNQGSTCAVSAARELVLERRSRLTIGFAIAVSAAGLVWLGLTWFGVADVALAGELPIRWPLFVGAGLLGLGAVINDGCLLGTIARIGDGEVRFLALPVGLAIGFAGTGQLPLPVTPPAATNPLAHVSEVGLVVVLIFVLALVGGWRWLRRGGDQPQGARWSIGLAMAVLGVSGAALFALAPGWSYADVVQHGVAPVGMMGVVTGPAGALAGAALLAGAILAGLQTRRFRFQMPRAATLLRSVAGGAVMAAGAAMVPGGNDTVLLAALPAATLSGLVGYLVMTGTVVGLLIAARTGWPAVRRALRR